MNNRPPLREDIFVEDLVEAYPELIGPLAFKGIVCIVCGEAYWGTLKELAASKGITDMEALIKDLRMDMAQGPI